jgi:hypothetical protein
MIWGVVRILCVSANCGASFAGEPGKLVEFCFKYIVRDDPDKTFTAVFRVAGGFERALLPSLSMNRLEVMDSSTLSVSSKQA